MTTPEFRISTELLDAVRGATPDDIEFSSEPARLHQVPPGTCTAFRPTQIRGLPVPAEVQVLYTREEGPVGPSWVVANWLPPAPRPQDVYFWLMVASGADARSIVLREVQEALGALPKDGPAGPFVRYTQSLRRWMMIPDAFKVSGEFVDAVRAASIDEIEFLSRPARMHQGRPGRRTGFTPTRIRGIAVPAALRIVYLKEEQSTNSHCRVLNWLKPDPEGDCYLIVVHTEAEARAILLREIQDSLAVLADL